MSFSLKIPEFPGRIYTRGGFFPFFHPKFSKIIAGKIQQIYSDNIQNETYCCIFNQSLETLDPIDWAKKNYSTCF